MTAASCDACNAYVVAERAAIADDATEAPMPHHSIDASACTCEEPIALTWYRNKETSIGLPISMDRDELKFALGDPAPLALVRTPRNSEEADDAYAARVLDRSKKRLSLISTASFSGRRREENVIGVSMLGLDLDQPTDSPERTLTLVRKALGDVECYAYSTASSKPEAYKLRVLVPYNRPATAAEHRSSWALVYRMLANVGIDIDRSCCDPNRVFFVWAVPPNGVYWHAHVGGEPWPVELAAKVEAERLAKESQRAKRRAASRPSSSTPLIERARNYIEKMPAAISGAGGHDATFAVARRLVADFELDDADAWELLCEYNTRCQPPWSERELRHKLASAHKARVRVDMENRQ